jgi:hypothetical protein
LKNNLFQSEIELAYSNISDSNFLISTNFNLADPSNGLYPCYRYSTATTMLEEIIYEEQLTVEICKDVLNEVKSWNTAYSNIFNPVNLDFYVYHNKNFDNVVKLNLDEELEKIIPGTSGVEIFTFIGGRIYPIGGSDEIIAKMIPIADLYKISSSISNDNFLIVIILCLSAIGIILRIRISKKILNP